ncbi:hypothetical protein SUGI_1163350 [Cryptomeria japonica]|nr:hypothetical protein SUGI_1163350 [Cryptomeria japonica]
MIDYLPMDEVRKRKSRRNMGIRGSKPTPLKVSKNTHNCIKIQPLIIYLRSPEVIHTQPKDFMAVVQRLTGCSSSSSSSLPKEDLTALQTNPKAFCHLQMQDFSAYEITPTPPVWANDYLSEVISLPWNSLTEELELEINWDPEIQLFSPHASQLFDFPLAELQPFNCLFDADNPYI